MRRLGLVGGGLLGVGVERVLVRVGLEVVVQVLLGVGLSLAMVYALVPCLIKAVSAIWLFNALSKLEGQT